MVTGGNYPTRPFISRASVAEALNVLLHHSIYEPSLSLYNLTLVDEYLAQRSLPPMENARAYALSNLIADIITRHYQKHRGISELSPVETTAVRTISLANIKEDAAANSNDLMGWAVLYYRYIRTELELSQETLSGLISMSERAIRRHQSRGIDTLAFELVTEEEQARARVSKLYLQAALPSSRPVPLFGRETLAQTGLDTLLTTPAPPIVITGSIGIGKTTLAQEISRRRIHSDTAPPLRKLIWISSPVTVEDVFYPVQSRLSETDHDDSTSTATYSLLNMSILIVIDDADALSQQDLEHCLQTLSSAALIVTVRSFRSPYHAALHLPLQEFNPTDVHSYLAYLSQYEPLVEVNNDDLHHILETVGGNPLAIRLALHAHLSGQPLNTTSSTVTEYFQQLFHHVSIAAQRGWVMLVLAPHDGASLSVLYQLRPDLPAAAFFELVDRQIAQYHPDDQHFTLLPITRTALLTCDQAYNIDLSPYIIEALTQLLRVDEAALSVQIPFLEQLLKTALDFQIPLPLAQLDQAFDILQTQPALRTPHTWLRLLEWRYRQQPEQVILGLELARALRKAQDWERAQLELERAVENTGRDGAFVLQGQAMLEFAVLMRQRGAYPQAKRLLERGRQIAARFHAHGLYQEIQLNSAQISIDESNPQLAQSYLNELPVTIERLALQSEAALLMGQFESGVQLAHTALRQSAGNRRYTAALQILLGRLYHAQGSDRKARRELERAVISLEELAYPFALGRAWMNLGIVLDALGDRWDALQLLERSAALQESIRDWVGLEITQYNLNQLKG